MRMLDKVRDWFIARQITRCDLDESSRLLKGGIVDNIIAKNEYRKSVKELAGEVLKRVEGADAHN